MKVKTLNCRSNFVRKTLKFSIFLNKRGYDGGWLSEPPQQPPTTMVGSQNRFSSPFRTLNHLKKKDTTLIQGYNRHRNPYINTPRAHFSFTLSSSSSLVSLSLSSFILAQLHFQTKIHSSHLVSGIHSYFCTVCIFRLFAFSF